MIAIIIQARMGSTRLPDKIMKNLAGKPILWHVVERCKKSFADKVIVATTIEAEDNIIEKFCRGNNTLFFRGSANNVLERYYEAAKKFGADVVARITSDCPLIDPIIIDRCIEAFQKSGADYISNVIPERTFPRGLDVEVFNFASLEKSYRQATKTYEKEHVTPYIWENKKNEFVIGKAVIADAKYNRGYRLTVDYPEDFALMEKIYSKFFVLGKIISIPEVLSFLDTKPDLLKINAHCEQKPLKQIMKSLLIAIPGGWMKKGADGLWHSTGFDDLKEHFGAPGSALRIEAGAILFKKNPNSAIAVLGGKGQLRHIQDARPLAEIMKRELVGLGVPEEKILEEAESGATYEQLKALIEIAERISPDEIIIISNRYHLPRMEAMAAHAPILKDDAKKFKIKFASAEDILLENDSKPWGKILKTAYDSAEIKKLMKKEESGARQVREGKYKYPVKFSLRRVEPRDSDFLFNLRNDELVRRLSRQTELIDFDTHKKWFKKKMSKQDSVIFIAENGAEPIAQTRFDFIGENTAEVNIAVSADFRGKGYGTEILKEATRTFLDSYPNIAAVRAFIKPENTASLRSFAKAGFILKDKAAARNQEYIAMVLKK